MKAFNKKKKRKHYSKGKYYKGLREYKYYFFRCYPVKMIGVVFKDVDGLIFEAWKNNKHKFKNNFGGVSR